MYLLRVIYPALMSIARTFVRRESGRELSFQRRMRAADWKTQLSYSRKRAIEYANHMAEVSPAYRKLLRQWEVCLPIREENWQTLPTLCKKDLQQDPNSWFNSTLQPDSVSWSSTSGSSGEPFRFPETRESRMAEFISAELNMRDIGWRPGMPEALIKVLPPKITGLRRCIRQMLGTLPVSFSAINYRADDTPMIVEAINRAGVQYLKSYPTVLLLLAEEMLKRNLRCHVPMIIVFGEGLSPARAQVIEEAFQAKVYRDYGGSEAMHIGFQCTKCPSYRLDLARFYVEVLDGNTPVPYGQAGEIVVTSFRNSAFPFVRYRMGDVAAMIDPETRCPCGGGVWRLGEIQGRIIDVIYTPNGERLDAAFLVVVMEHAHDHILAYKFLQREPDLVEVLYVPRHERAMQHLAPIEKQIVDRVKGGLRLTWTSVPEISPDPSGKRKILVPLKQEWKTSVE